MRQHAPGCRRTSPATRDASSPPASRASNRRAASFRKSSAPAACTATGCERRWKTSPVQAICTNILNCVQATNIQHLLREPVIFKILASNRTVVVLPHKNRCPFRPELYHRYYKLASSMCRVCGSTLLERTLLPQPNDIMGIPHSSARIPADSHTSSIAGPERQVRAHK